MASKICLKFTAANIKVIKITDDTTSEILGLTAITLETGDEAAEREITSISIASAAGPPPGMNWELVAEVIVGLKKLDELMVGKEH